MTKKIKLATLLLFVTGLAFAQNAQKTDEAEQNPPIRGVGIVVKKKPSNGASKALAATNDKGITEFTLTEKGSYTFTLTNPSKGQAKTQGGPVKGVKIGLGKNPPGGCCNSNQRCCFNKVSNKNGEVEFNDLEPGNYQITILKDNIETLEPIKTNKEMKKTEVKVGD